MSGSRAVILSFICLRTQVLGCLADSAVSICLRTIASSAVWSPRRPISQSLGSAALRLWPDLAVFPPQICAALLSSQLIHTEPVRIEKMVARGWGGAHFTQVTHRELSPGAMTPHTAIAERERPQRFRHAVEGCGVVAKSVSDCYESFTLSSLFSRGPVATFARVMTEAFTDISRGAGAAVRARRGNHRPFQLSAQNVLSSFSNRQLQTANRLPS
jgi:hypothetical protein